MAGLLLAVTAVAALGVVAIYGLAPAPPRKSFLPDDRPVEPDPLLPIREGMVRLELRDHDGHIDHGAGFFVEKDLIIAANPLLVRHPPKPRREVFASHRVMLSDPGRIRKERFTITSFGPGSAFQFVLCHAVEERPPLEVSFLPLTDAPVTVCGFAGDPPEFRAISAKCTYPPPPYDVRLPDWFDLDFVPPADWHYGGPVLDAEHLVVGMVTLPRSGKSTATVLPLSAIDQFRAEYASLHALFRTQPPRRNR